MSQTFCAGDHLTGGQSAAGKGGGSCLVLQPEAEGEEDDTAWCRPDAGGRVLSGRQRECRHTAPVHGLQTYVH